MTPTEPLSWGAKVAGDFRDRLYLMMDGLGWPEERASWLMAVMAFETGQTFSPSVRNPGSSAVGLIQFMAQTARDLGTRSATLASLSAVSQLHYVQRYLAPMAPRIDNLEDLYMAVLWPAAIGRSPDAMLWAKGGNPYAANRGLDLDRNGRITKREACKKVRDLLAKGYASGNVWNPRP